jgi:hypothetical protein
VRVTNVYATPWRLDDEPTGHLGAHLRLWRLERDYRISADQFPTVVSRQTVRPDALSFKRFKAAGRVRGARVWLLRLPSAQIVAVFSVDVDCKLGDTIRLLEDCYFGDDVRIDQATLEEFAHTTAEGLGFDTGSEPAFLPERHQVVFGPIAPAAGNADELTQRLIYRADLPYQSQNSEIRHPGELNRRPGWLAAVSPYVSVVCGHADFIENAVFISAVQAVGAAAELRQIRHAAHRAVRLFRRGQHADTATIAQRRRLLERITDELSDFELELSYSVEASIDLGLLVPSLRAESFHTALYESMCLADRAQTVARMLQRLAHAADAELTAIESIERRADDDRRIRWTVAAGFVSTIAIPSGLILAFFGINATQVDPGRSIFDHHYLDVYLLVAAIVALGGLLYVALYAQHRARAHPAAERVKTSPSRQPITGRTDWQESGAEAGELA